MNLQTLTLAEVANNVIARNGMATTLETNGVTPAFLPPCSSYFNPIETVWSWVKEKWKNSLLQLKDLNEIHAEWMAEELSRIC